MKGGVIRRNITLSLEEEILRKARIVAAQRGLSVSALLREELVRLVDDHERFAAARQAARRRLKAGTRLGGGKLPAREELHNRGDFR